MKDHRLIFLSLCIMVVGGCSLLQPKDRPGRELTEAELAAIPDAVPVKEPLAANGNPESYEVNGRTYHVMKNAEGFVQHGKASWYGKKFHGKRTSSGEIYDMYKMTAAHKTLPLPTYARITNLENQRSVVVKINDRGPFAKDRAIDLSYVAAKKLGIVGKGTADVEIRVLTPGEDNRSEIVASAVEDMQPLDATPIAKTVPAETATPADTVMATEPAAKPVVEQTAGAGIYLQVGAFSQPDNAERLRLRMEEMQSHPVETIITPTAKGELYKVRIGPFPSATELRETQSLLRQKGHRQFRRIGI